MRRWRAHSKLFALVIGVAVIAGSVLCGSILLVGSAENAGVRGALSSLAADRVDVTARAVNPSSPVSDARAAIDAATAKAYGAGASWSSTGWVLSDFSTTPDGVYSYLVELDDPKQEATLIEGAWPASPPGIALPQSAARLLKLNVGDSLVLGDVAAPVTLRIDGIYTATPQTGTYWEYDPLLSEGASDAFPKPNVSFYNPVRAVGPLITAPGGVDASTIGPAQLLVVEHPAFTSTDVPGLARLQQRAASAENEIARAAVGRQGDVFIDTALPDALDDVRAGLDATRAGALVIALLMAVVLGVTAASVTRLLVDARAAELDMLLARGSSGSQRAVAVVVDAVAIAVLTALLSPLGGVLLHALIADIPPLSSAGLPLWVLPDSTVLLCASAVAVAVGGLVCFSPSRSAARSRTTRLHALQPASQAAVVAIAALMVWRVATIDPQPGDALLALTPALVVAAFAIVGSRLVAVVARPFGALASRSRGAVAPLAGWFAARNGHRSTGIVLIALTVGASVVAIGTSATWQQSVQDEAAIALGAPARAAPGIDAEAGGRAGSPVMRRQTLLSKKAEAGSDDSSPGSSTQILALDAAARKLLGGKGSVDAVSRAGGAAIRDAFPSFDSDDSGPLLPEGTAALRFSTTISAPEGVTAAVRAVVEDSRGLVSILPLGEFAAPMQPTSLTSAPGAIQPSAGGRLRLVAVTASLRGAESSPPVTVTVTLDDATALPADGSAPVPVVLADAAGWQAFTQDDYARPSPIVVADSSLQLSVTAQLKPQSLGFGAVGWDPNQTIGAVVPVTLADDLDVASGAQLSGFVAGAPIVVRVIGMSDGVPGAATADDLESLAAGLPSASRVTSSIVVDSRALVHGLVQASAYGPFVDEYWSASTAPGDAGVDSEALARQMMEAPLRAEIPASASVAVCASLLLALAGFGARAASVNRSRRLEAAQLRAIGLSRRAMLGVESVDTVTTAVAGIVIGLLAGLATLMLVGTRIAAAPSGFAVELVLPWQAFTLLPFALATVLGLVSVSIARSQRRLPLPELLRAGGDE